MDSIRFILDDQTVAIDSVDPTRTVLQYLREDVRRVGSKEGCAEGDCGACTVVLAELIDDSIRYRAVNACIQFLPTLDGKALFTVESLSSGEAGLHPVQQAMVDYHGSQCGFCTPGFVMSMFALYQNNRNPNRDEIDDALSGNLCRCTGYRPIIDACLHMDDYTEARIDEARLCKQLQALQRKQGVEINAADGRYHAPVTLVELAEIYQQNPAAQILAGGTDVGLWVTKQLRELREIIYIGNVGELHQITTTDDMIEIGAAVSLTDAFAALKTEFPEFAEMFRRFASVPVRNAGTLVGNIANSSPIGDSMPALIVVGSTVRLRLGDQSRELAMQDLYLDYMKNAMQPGEFVESVRIPLPAAGTQLRCYKLSKRFDQDISAVCAAFALQLEGDQVTDIRIALGGMAAIPKRATITEDFLRGASWNEGIVKAAMDKLSEDFSPMSDMRASAEYRHRATANLLLRFYLQTRTENPLAEIDSNVFQVSA